jgi:hypothetical protein
MSCPPDLLVEYTSLRNEIMQRQRFRMLIISFTLAAVGVTLGLVFGDSSSLLSVEKKGFAEFLICYILVLINGALVLTIENTQQIHIISKYIIRYLESKCDELKWETKWTGYWNKRQKEDQIPLPGYPWAIGRSLAIFYFVLTASVYIVIFFKQLHPAAIIISTFLAYIACLLILDLYFRITKGWEDPWS